MVVSYRHIPQMKCFDWTDLRVESSLSKQSTNGRHVALPCVLDPAKPTVYAVGDCFSRVSPRCTNACLSAVCFHFHKKDAGVEP